MKHIPIMLALALSISVSSYDTNTIENTNNTSLTEESSIKINTSESDILNEELNIKLLTP